MGKEDKLETARWVQAERSSRQGISNFFQRTYACLRCGQALILLC